MKKQLNQYGRTMIEMLGVLAIAGILSIGGIAAFQKAMTKYKVTKWTENMTSLVQTYVNYKKDWMEIAKRKNGLVNAIRDISPERVGLLPQGWIYKNAVIYDNYGNELNLYAYPNSIFIGLNIFTKRRDYEELCLRMWTNVIIPYSEIIHFVHCYGRNSETNATSHAAQYKGDAYCSIIDSCIKDMTMAEIMAICTKVKEDKLLNFSIYFK